MAQYRISKSYEVDLIIEASKAVDALELAKEAKLVVQVDAGSTKVLAASARDTGTLTTHKAAVTQAQVNERARAKAEEAQRAKIKVAARKAREAELRVMLGDRGGHL
jgi:hypothetical protein